MASKNNLYKQAGVDVEAGYEAVNLMKKHAEKTAILGVLGGLGSFGGIFDLSHHMVENPLLVSGADGVGTKLIVAFQMDKHDTIGIDVVAMCVNDILAMGAKPIYFLDYIATGKLNPAQAAEIVKGISKGCIEAGCALIGGETAEMPDIYKEKEYDLAGFVTGIVSKDKLITGENIKEGDILVGLASSGVHSSGFSLVRKILKDTNFQIPAKDIFNKYIPNCEDENIKIDNISLGELLLKPTKIYVKQVLELLKTIDLKGIAHITGGGFYENIPRMLPKGLGAKIDLGSWRVLPIFKLLQEKGEIPEEEMFGVFNMGIGMVLAVNKEDAHKIENAYIIGSVVKGDGVIFNETEGGE
ncbi:MAG: phosphoribosylformylglycinamidine cyclo-ligase [Defluviitaleaceae bacterium]|nr:phosphoribosylformylglycinamidine cyclo-ligase [Defluviitaleaceae bacterium]